jgi:hypothetical protein
MLAICMGMNGVSSVSTYCCRRQPGSLQRVMENPEANSSLLTATRLCH